MSALPDIKPVRKWVPITPTFWKLMSGAHPKPIAYVRDKGRNYFNWWLAGNVYGGHTSTLDQAKDEAIAAVKLFANRASSKSVNA